MAGFRPPVESRILTWARESAFLQPADAAHRIGVRDETLLAWEAGGEGPTLSQLRKAAAVYGQPIATFLLETPPPEATTLIALRTLPSSEARPPSPAFVAGLRRASFQQAVARNLADLAGEPPAAIDLRLRLSARPEAAGAAVRGWLGVSIEQQLAWRTPGDAFRGWAAAIEGKGILVIHVARVDLAEMRAFAERTRPIPVIGLNGKDAPAGKLFSLIHELAHILLDADGGPALHVFRGEAVSGASAAVERYCNGVAAAALMPRDDLLFLPEVAAAGQDAAWGDDQLRALAARYGVSREAVLLRLVGLGTASEAFYLAKRKQFEAEYRELAQGQRQGAGGDYYRLKVRDLGRRFVAAVLAAYDRDAISSRDVTQYLGVQLAHLPQLARLVGHGR